MTRIKICGLRKAEDAQAVANAGADALGLVFYPPSPRAVDVTTAVDIVRAAGPLVTTVALFVNPSETEVELVLEQVKPHVLQFHGDESPGFCEQFDRDYLKAIRVKEDTDIVAATASYRAASGFIFDAWHETLYGGTGEKFDWEKIRGFDSAPVILAGGLNADNVAGAIATAAPYGVDVSGGVESSRGVKSAEKIATFVKTVRAAG